MCLMSNGFSPWAMATFCQSFCPYLNDRYWIDDVLVLPIRIFSCQITPLTFDSWQTPATEKGHAFHMN